MVNETELLMLYRRKKRNKIILFVILMIVIITICIFGFIYVYKDADPIYFDPKIQLNKTDYEYVDGIFKIGVSKSENIKVEDLIASYNKKYFKMKIGNDKKTKKNLDSMSKRIPGNYQINVVFSNDYHTEKKLLKINIFDDVPPTLELSSESIEINTNDAIDYKLYIVKAEDNIDKLNIDDVIFNEINTAVSGEYTLNYVLQDKSGNETSKDIRVLVKQPVSTNTINDAPKVSANEQKNQISNFSTKKNESSESSSGNKFFSGNSIESYNQALEYAEKNGKKGYEVKPTGEGFQVILY